MEFDIVASKSDILWRRFQFLPQKVWATQLQRVGRGMFPSPPTDLRRCRFGGRGWNFARRHRWRRKTNHVTNRPVGTKFKMATNYSGDRSRNFERGREMYQPRSTLCKCTQRTIRVLHGKTRLTDKYSEATREGGPPTASHVPPYESAAWHFRYVWCFGLTYVKFVNIFSQSDFASIDRYVF